MRQPPPKILAIALGCLAAVVGLSGCGTGYQQQDGQWVYVTWDEGHGYRSKPLNVDGALKVLANPDYAVDNCHAFKEGEIIASADGASFRLLPNQLHAKDKDRVFINGVEIIGAEPDSFKVLGVPYGMDAKTIFCGTVPIRMRLGQEISVLSMSDLFSKFPSGARFNEWYGDRYDGLEVDPDKPCVVGFGKIRIGDEIFRGPIKVGTAE